MFMPMAAIMLSRDASADLQALHVQAEGVASSTTSTLEHLTSKNSVVSMEQPVEENVLSLITDSNRTKVLLVQY
jgi:hypothetical protein